MSLADDVGAAITDAMRRKDAARLSALRMLKAAFMNREVEKGRALDDAELRQVVQSLVKQRRDSIEQFIKGGAGLREERSAGEEVRLLAQQRDARAVRPAACPQSQRNALGFNSADPGLLSVIGSGQRVASTSAVVCQ